MIIEALNIKDEYFELSKQLIASLNKKALLKKDKLVIGIGGESGSGKSVTAKCLQLSLNKLNIDSAILHQDNYYKFPPEENHIKRKADINWVGSNEVNLDQIAANIQAFKGNEKAIIAPIVDYANNVFLEQELSFVGKSVLIVEGVYILLLKQLDYKVFLERNYKDTLEKRKSRSREVYDPFTEQVLEIEHLLIQPLMKDANATISKAYEFKEI